MAAEQALVARAREGDEAAFRSLVVRYEDLVAATVIGMLGPGPEADDAGQETFIRFYRALGRYAGTGGVAPYLTRIAINVSLDAIERRKRWSRRFFRPEEGVDWVGETPPDDSADVQDIVRSALRRLNPDARAVVVLRLIDGYSTKETADMLGIPLGTVLSRLARAQKELRTLLGPYLEDA